MRRAAQARTAGLHPVSPATLIMYCTASVGVYWTRVVEHGVEAAQQLAHTEVAMVTIPARLGHAAQWESPSRDSRST